jgi:hypothetical protein
MRSQQTLSVFIFAFVVMAMNYLVGKVSSHAQPVSAQGFPKRFQRTYQADDSNKEFSRHKVQEKS